MLNDVQIAKLNKASKLPDPFFICTPHQSPVAVLAKRLAEPPSEEHPDELFGPSRPAAPFGEHDLAFVETIDTPADALFLLTKDQGYQHQLFARRQACYDELVAQGVIDAAEDENDEEGEE